ncbi:MAG TPA: hypothetical protein VGK54_10725, partial [Chloroflexota bacterium]
MITCLAFAIATGSQMLSSDGDAARHLTIGEHILSTGDINVVNLFSLARAGEAMPPYEWLARVISASTYHLAGLGGVVLIHALVFGLAFAFVFRQMVTRGVSPRVARWVTALALTAAAVHWLARPHMFTLLGTAIFASVLDAWYSGRANPRRLWLLPMLMIAWVNLNGGFIAGLLLVATYIAADLVRWAASVNWDGQAAVIRLRTAFPVAVATCLATLVTPVGPGLLAHFQAAMGEHLVIDRTAEFQSPNFHQMPYLSFLVMLVAVMLSVAWSKRRPSLQEGLQLAGFTAMALMSARNIPLFAIVVAPILGAQIMALPLQAGRFFRPALAASPKPASVADPRSRGWRAHLAAASIAVGLFSVAII